MKKTKIIATIGSENNDIKLIQDMIIEGVDVFRINLSYTDLKVCDSLIEKIRKSEKNTNKIVGIMLDLDGPSIRIDKLKEDEVELLIDKEIRIYDYHVVCNNTQISTTCNTLSKLVNINDIISVGYGDVKLKVIEINDDNFLCTVVDSGIIKSNQVLHVENSYLQLPFISKKDKENILYAIENNIDFLALSYVRDEQDVLEVVDFLIEKGNEHIELISKIETNEAYENLEEILKVSDGIMVSRGDLGINISLEKLPIYQKEILKITHENEKIGLVSTNFLKSMVHEKTPSRGEILDIYNTVFDNASGLVLTDETTVGENALESIDMMNKILVEAESNYNYTENLENTFKEGEVNITKTISYSVVNSSILLDSKCILANTMSGYTARMISYFRPNCPIIAFSPNKDTLHSLTLNYGVTPIHIKKFNSTDDIISECLNKYKELFDYKKDDIVILTGGLPINSKNTDFMKIEKIN